MSEQRTSAAGRGLQIVGGLALVAWTVGGLAAWKATADGVHVTIAEEADATEGPDPLALLGDQVGVLQADLRGLTGTLSENLGALAGDLDARATAQARELEALSADVAALRVHVAQGTEAAAAGDLDARLARLEGLLQEVLTANADTAERERLAAELAAAEREREAARAEAEAQRAAELARLDEEREAARAAAADEPAAPSGQRSFLAFQLPSDDFRFDERQSFRIVTNLSRVGFDAKSTLHDFTGVSQRASGEWIVNLAHPEEGIEGTLDVPAASLDTALEGRDEEMRKVLDVETYPSISFAATSFDVEELDEAAQTIRGTVRGRMTVHGETQDVAMKVSGQVDESRRLRVDGEVTLKMSSFGVKPPSKLGMISVEDEVRVWVSLCARPAPVTDAVARGEG